MTHRTLVVHATHLLARGFLVVSTDRKSGSGEATNALYAATRAILRALTFKQPQSAVAILDSEVDPDKVPKLLAPQLAVWPSVLETLGFHIVHAPGAAHVVASYTHQSLELGNDVVIVGSDKRFAQLVREGSVWWYDAYKDVRYSPQLVKKRFEVEPDKVAGWLALVGDDDTLPGVDGIGKKGATDIVLAFGSVEQALLDADAVPGRTGKMLRASLDAAKNQVDRAHLRQDLPLPTPLEQLSYRPAAQSRTNELFAKLGFNELLGTDQDKGAVVITSCDHSGSALAAIESFGNTLVSLVVVTEDPSPVRGQLTGLAASRGDGTAFYFPFAGLGDTIEPSLLSSWLADPARPKIGHEINSVVVAFARLHIAVAGIVGDTACASHLHEPSNWAPHDLPIVARHRIQRALDEDEVVRGVGASRKPWAKIPVDRAAELAGARADAVGALWASFQPTVPRELLDEYLALSETVARMELHGIACDGDDLLRAGEYFTTLAGELEAQIHEIAGKAFNLGSTKQLGSILYETFKLPIVKRTKTGWSTANEALERIENAHPIVGLVMRWREVQRLKDSWATSLRASIDADGRIHSTFHPARSFSGRIINTQPDLGRVPGRTPEMARIRRAFRAPPGTKLLSVDYNQLGLYVLAHLSEDPNLVEPLRRGDDLHLLTAAAVLDIPVASVGKAERQKGKVVNFATFAGQGPSALSLQLGLSAQEAKLLIERFDRHYAQVRAFQERQLALSREQGFIITLAGRKWPIGDLSALDPQIRSNADRMARRATHEGSVADVSRRGLLRADQALRAAGLRAQALLQVHDEVLFEVPEEELVQAAEIASEAMRRAFDLLVPLRVGCKSGSNWGELQPL